MDTQTDGPFLSVKATGHPIALVAFSHIDTPAGRFAQYRVLEALPYAKIYLNCPDNGYYLRAIPGVGDGVETIAARLKAEIAALAPARVVFFGNSMGAYGALLYGALLGADLTIAMAPEVRLGIRGGAMMRAAKDKTICRDAHAIALAEIVRAAPRGERVCLFGEKALADMRCALALAGTGAAAIGLRNASHSVAPFLHGASDLSRVIAGIVEQGTASPLIAAHAGDLLGSPALIDRLYEAAWEGKPLGHFARLATSIAGDASAETLAYAWLAHGRALKAMGARRQALAYIFAAAMANPGDIEAYPLLLAFAEGRRLAGRIDREALKAAVWTHRFDTTLPYCRFLAALQIAGETTAPDVAAAIAKARLPPGVEAKVALQRAELRAGHDEAAGAEAEPSRG